MARIFDRLEPLTLVDPLLLYGFVYVCPQKDFHKLIPRIHPFVTIAFLASHLNGGISFPYKEVCVIQQCCHVCKVYIAVNFKEELVSIIPTIIATLKDSKMK